MDLIKKRNLVVEALRQIDDPEIGMNIIDVGLIYGIFINEWNKVTIEMTLTTPGCPLTDYFLSEIETKMMDLDFVEDVQIDFVWTPQWDMTMMDEGGKQRMFENMRK